MIDKKSLEDKFRIFKENVVTDFSAKVVFPLAVKNLQLLDKVVGILKKYNISLLGLKDLSSEDFKFGEINYNDIQWMVYKPKIAHNVYKKIYNNVNFRKSEKAKLISDRDLFLVKLEDNLLTKETKQFLNHIVEDLNKAIDENIETEYVLDTSNDIEMNNGITKHLFNTENKKNTNLLDMFSHIQQAADKNNEDLFGSNSLKDALKQLLSYASVDDGSAERMLDEQKRHRINSAFNKDLADQEMANETTEFVKVFTSAIDSKNADIFDNQNCDSLSAEEKAEFLDQLGKDMHVQAEEAPVRLYSSSIKDHFANLEDIDHWEKKDKE